MKHHYKYPFENFSLLLDTLNSTRKNVEHMFYVPVLPALPVFPDISWMNSNAATKFINDIDNDRQYFSSLKSAYDSELQSALRKSIPISFIKDNAIFRTTDGINFEKISDVIPMIPAPKRTFKLK